MTRPRTSHALAGVVLMSVLGCSGSSGSGARSGDGDGSGADGSGRADPSGEAPAGESGVLLESHNRFREAHCAPPLAWSEELATTAQAWADKLAASCAIQHSDAPHGENLAFGTNLGPEQTVQVWYAENSKYDFERGTFSMQSGHFTQVVWAGTQHVGCGTATCDGAQRIWVCNYDPPGNVQRHYAENVLPTTCKK